MKKGQGTLKELTLLWRQLDGRGRSSVIAIANGEVQYLMQHPEARRDAISPTEDIDAVILKLAR